MSEGIREFDTPEPSRDLRRKDSDMRRAALGVVSSLLAVALIAAPLCACSGGREASTDDATQSATEDASQGDHTKKELPAKYDMREKGLVTPVKNQSPFGSCWAFGGIAAAESSIIIAAGGEVKAEDLDLSEKHLTWYSQQAITELEDETQVGEGLHPVDEENPNAAYDAGGTHFVIGNLFASGVGPMTEEEYPYRGKDAILSSTYWEQHPDVRG